MTLQPKELEKEIEKGRQQLEEKSKELEALRNQMLRLQADFDNAKKRWLKEQAEFQEVANRDLLMQLLEVFDDFQRALAAENPAQEPQKFRAGVEMIAKRVGDFLKSYGVVPIEVEGKLFDPTQHEAVAHEATDQVPESTVIGELRRGYWMNGRVLRHAVVRVAVKPETEGTPK